MVTRAAIRCQRLSSCPGANNSQVGTIPWSRVRQFDANVSARVPARQDVHMHVGHRLARALPVLDAEVRGAGTRMALDDPLNDAHRAEEVNSFFVLKILQKWYQSTRNDQHVPWHERFQIHEGHRQPGSGDKEELPGVEADSCEHLLLGELALLDVLRRCEGLSVGPGLRRHLLGRAVAALAVGGHLELPLLCPGAARGQPGAPSLDGAVDVVVHLKVPGPPRDDVRVHVRHRLSRRPAVGERHVRGRRAASASRGRRRAHRSPKVVEFRFVKVGGAWNDTPWEHQQVPRRDGLRAREHQREARRRGGADEAGVEVAVSKAHTGVLSAAALDGSAAKEADRDGEAWPQSGAGAELGSTAGPATPAMVSSRSERPRSSARARGVRLQVSEGRRNGL
eukprot:CAMPEP_0204513672 /NCGR_PEP_ID=MMETSP0661-20131031/1635_1 /ASSEMBLY_ACC=CAM_ASM_000606 /TAXON_ID=109239 /ORGANISM="Alexandrium margalefi, Strain AMGDE01CS-322" /LENGTH=394 /DNA_ID=CAMNT_0051518859 /DNA_START=1 /DNA_END=1182 /DNA_ORIENTATION=-